jgi:ketosteroid isomerase-like protein
MPVANTSDARRAVDKQLMDDPNFQLQFVATKVEVAKSGDVGYTEGSYMMTMTDPATKQPMTDKGKYVTVYKKQADGSWKAVEDMQNSDMPMPTPPAAAPTMMKK